MLGTEKLFIAIIVWVLFFFTLEQVIVRSIEKAYYNIEKRKQEQNKRSIMKEKTED